jgi:hypothetical protein
MTTLAFASPILPGKLEAWLRFNQESLGSRLAQHKESRTRLGITRELSWLQQTPDGDLAIVYIEVADPERMFEEMATSQQAYDVWFRQQVQEIHGLDLTAPPDGPLSQLSYVWESESNEASVLP